MRFAHNPFRNAPNTSPVGTFTSVRPRLRSYGSLGEIGAALAGPHPPAADRAARKRDQIHQQELCQEQDEEKDEATADSVLIHVLRHY